MPPHFLLISPDGLKFSCMAAQHGHSVRVAHKDKAMFFSIPSAKLVTAWGDWKKGDKLEEALPFLDEKERRYLQTGLLPEEEEVPKEE